MPGCAIKAKNRKILLAVTQDRPPRQADRKLPLFYTAKLGKVMTRSILLLLSAAATVLLAVTKPAYAAVKGKDHIEKKRQQSRFGSTVEGRRAQG